MDLYRVLGDDLDTVDLLTPHLAPGASVLDVGAGVGRIADPMCERGFVVTAMDESPQMLAHVRCARTWCSDLMTADFAGHFDAAILASFLIDTLPAERVQILQACARAVRPGGDVFVQRQPPSFYDALGERPAAAEPGISVGVADLRRLDENRWSVTLIYRTSRATWDQRIVCRRFADADLDGDFAAAGLLLLPPLDERRSWLHARRR